MKKRRNGLVHHHTLKSVRAVVLGKDGVGKSALTVRFLTRRFIGDYDSSLEATFRHHLLIDGQFVCLDIMDTAGKNSTEKMQMCLSFAELFFIVYSTTDRTSFREAALLVRYILQDKSLSSNAVVMIVATKSDLKHAREVEEYEGLFLAQDLSCGFCQLSNSEGYAETHELLVHSLKRCLSRGDEKSKSSPLSRVKEGLVETAKSLRRKSFNHEVVTVATPEPRRPARARSFCEDILLPEKVKEKPLRKKSASHDNLKALEEDSFRNSMVSTVSI